MKINYNVIQFNTELFNFETINTTSLNNIKKITKLEENINVKKDTKLYEFLLKKYPEGFKEAKQVFVNGKEIKVENFDIKLKENDLITVAELPNYQILIMILVMIVISIVMYLIMKPKKPYQTAQNSVYSAKQTQIRAAYGDAIQIQYGRFRHYPKMIAEPYTFFYNNEEYHLVHTCCGTGNFNINKIYLNETGIENLLDNTQVQYYFLNGSVNKTGYAERFKDMNVNLKKYLGFTVHKPEELSGIDLNPVESSNRQIGYTIINANNSKINKILINFDFNQGIFYVSDENQDESAAVNIVIGVREIDENDNELPYYFEKVYSFSKNQRTPFRDTVLIDIKSGRYKIKIIRTDGVRKNETKNCNLVSVVGIEDKDYLENTKNLAIGSFLVKVGEGFSKSSGLKINVDLTRTQETIYNQVYRFNTLYDLVKDIWTNPTYGMKNIDLSYLDIRAELNEPVNVIFDKKDNAFEQLSAVLKSFGYIIYPYLSHYVIRKEEKIDYRSIIFSSKNTKSITKNIKINDNKERFDGVSGKYMPLGEVNTDTINYPIGKDSYDDTLLLGVSDFITAQKALIRFYNKKTKQLKSCSIKTDLEGFIPEIGSRVGVSNEYINENLSILGESIIDGVVVLQQKYDFKANTDYYFQIDTINNEQFNIMKVVNFPVDTFTDTFEIENNFMSLDSDNAFVVHIGDRIEIIEDYIITDIKPSEMGTSLTEYCEVNLICKEYVESIYE